MGVPYKAYIKVAEKRYQERFGLHFEEFHEGQKFQHRPGVTVSQQDNKEEALETLNSAQLHYDAHYAEQTEWKNCLGVSTLTLQKVLGMSWKTFGKKDRIVAYEEISMTSPVFGGDTLYAESEILQKADDSSNPNLGVLSVVTTGINQHGKVIAQIKYQILIYKRGFHPLDRQKKLTAVTEEKFSAYRELAKDSYIEETGIYYEGLDVGETYEHFPAKTFTQEEIRMHALYSLDWNPQYTDMSYVQKFQDGKMWVPEPFLIGSITALTTRTFGRVVANLQWKNIQLPLPVYSGDTIRAESIILSKRESKSRPTQGILQAKTSAYNQHDELVCIYERHFLIYKKGLGPYEKAGY